MKKSILLLLLIVSSFTIFAQTEKGNIELSGGAGFQFISSHLKYVNDGVTTGEATTNSFSFLPSIGYFVIDNLAIGLAGNFTSSSTKEEGDADKSISTSILIIPTAIYYVPMDGKIRPIIQIGAGLTSMSQKYGSEKSSASGLAINFGAGIASFIKDNISINFGLSYTLATLTDKDDNKSKLKEGNFGTNIGFSIYF